MNAIFRSLRWPLLICLLTLGFAGFSWYSQERLAQQALQSQFEAQSAQTVARLQARLDRSAQLLRSIQALYASSTELGPDALASFIKQQEPLAALHHIALAPLVLPEQRTAFIDAQRQAGQPSFTVQPGGERSLYAPVSRIFSAATNNPSELGRDLFADQDQQSVLMQARDSGDAALSGKLITGGAANSFILAMPLFAAGKAHNSMDERRSNLSGWIIARFDAAEWLTSSLDKTAPSLNLSLFSGPETDADSLVAQSGESKSNKAILTTRAELRAGDSHWTLTASAPAAFAAADNKTGPLIALLGGALALLLFIVTQYLSTRQALASRAAEKASEALHEAEERWRFALEGSGDGVWDWNLASGTIHFSSRCEVVLGVPTKGAAAALIHPEDEAPEKAAMQACLEGKTSQYVSEHRMQGEDGQWRWIAARGMVLARTESGAASRMIGTVTDVTERKTAADKLNHMAQHDAVTGLPNRTLFFDLLQHALHQAKRHKETLALAYIDLDNFKGIIDSFGHAVSHELLREVSKCLQEVIRDSDAVSHFGGDDFVVMLPNLASEGDTVLVTEKLRQSLDHEFIVNGRHISLTASIGVAVFPQQARTAESLINSATRAVLQARKSGRNTVCFGLKTDKDA